jgi:hypothetical protein
MSRSVQTVTISLTRKEVENLERYLALDVLKRYNNVTFANDCSSMVIRALNETTNFSLSTTIDPSPSSVMGALGIRKLAGDSQIGDHRLIIVGKNENTFLQRLRNLYVNVSEARLYQKYFVVNQSLRHGMDAIRGKSGQQWIEPETKLVFRDAADDIRTETENDPELVLLLAKREKIRTEWTSDQRDRLRLRFEERYQKVYDDLKAPNQSIFEYVGAIYKLETLSEYERKILGETQMNLSAGLEDPKFRAELEAFVNELREEE